MKTKSIKSILLLSIIALFLTSCVTRVEVSSVGLKVNLSGSDRGVSSVKYATGWTWYAPFFSTVVEYPVIYKTIEFPDYLVMCKGGTTFTSHPKLTYKINRLRADITYMSFGTDDMEVIENGYIHAATTKSLGDVANLFTPDTLLYSRERFEDMVQTDIKKQCDSLGIDITMFRSNLTPSDAIADAINAKQKAVQDAQKVQNEKASVIAEGEKKVAKAKLDAEALITTANANAQAAVIQAKADKESATLRLSYISPLYNQYLLAYGWNGVLPVYGQAPQLFKDISK